MSAANKMLQSMRNNPRDWAMDQVLTVAQRYGFEVRSSGGSHHVLSHPDLSEAAHRARPASDQADLHQAAARLDRPGDLN